MNEEEYGYYLGKLFIKEWEILNLKELLARGEDEHADSLAILIENEYQKSQLEDLNHELEQRKAELEEEHGRSLALLMENEFQQIELKELNTELENRKSELERAKSELETYNEILNKVNSSSDINEILDMIFAFIWAFFDIDVSWLLFVDKKQNELYTFLSNMNYVDEVGKKFFGEFRQKLDERLGSLYYTYKRQKTFYVSNVKKLKNVSNEIDIKVVEHSKLKGLIQVPLCVKGEVIGILCLSKKEEKLMFVREDIVRIERFCGQLAGAIYNSSLLEQVRNEGNRANKLLLNILPEQVAEELKQKGVVEPVYYQSVSVIFTDFKGFTKIAEKMDIHTLIGELDICFYQFDEITLRNKVEKIKTIGDSYMCVAGLPERNYTHAIDACFVALEIQKLMKVMKEAKVNINMPYWELRLGIHTGPVVAGVVVKHKFAYDIWGDTVNTASRMESSGMAGCINISQNTYQEIKYFFETEYRGKIKPKNKEELDMYFLNRLKKQYSNRHILLRCCFPALPDASQ